jgi:DNA-binding NtrC family response regulator
MEALDLLSRDSYNVAILDLLLPGMDGNTMIAKAQEIQPTLNYIIYTGSLYPELSEPLASAGINSDQIFIKPVESIYQFVEAIKKLST